MDLYKEVDNALVIIQWNSYYTKIVKAVNLSMKKQSPDLFFVSFSPEISFKATPVFGC